MRIRRRHLLPALGVAAALHAALFLTIQTRPEQGAEAIGINGIEVALGPAGGTPSESTPVTEGSEPEAIEPETTEIEPIEATEPEVPQEVEVAELNEPEPVVVQEVVKAKPKPKPEPQVSSESSKPESPPDEDIFPEQPQVEKVTNGKAGTSEPDIAGSQSSVSAGGTPAATADFVNTLRAWFEQHKQYPRRARLRRQEGIAVLRFTMNREGEVMSYTLEESSGHTMLDKEVKAMIERAQPLPRMPSDMQQASLELVLPVQFFLR